jgi:hypothetical protein
VGARVGVRALAVRHPADHVRARRHRVREEFVRAGVPKDTFLWKRDDLHVRNVGPLLARRKHATQRRQTADSVDIHVRPQAGAAVPDVRSDGASCAFADILDGILAFSVVDVRDGLRERPGVVRREVVCDVRLVEVDVAVQKPRRDETTVRVEVRVGVACVGLDRNDVAGVDGDIGALSVGQCRVSHHEIAFHTPVWLHDDLVFRARGAL